MDSGDLPSHAGDCGYFIYLFVYLLRTKQQKHIHGNTLNLTAYYSLLIETQHYV